MQTPFDKRLDADEFVELGELLAQMPEPFEPMEADYMDGFLTGILCLPEEPAPSEWMPKVFDAQERVDAQLPDPEAQNRLEELVYRRYRSLDKDLCARRPLDPIVYEIEDERGRPVRGWAALEALRPFASGFLEAMMTWPGLKDTGDELVESALLGILRHLPEEEIGDLADVRNDLELESPLETLDQALEDIAVSVAEIVSVTRGISLEEPKRAPAGKQAGKKSFGPGKKHFGPGKGPRGPRRN